MRNLRPTLMCRYDKRMSPSRKSVRRKEGIPAQGLNNTFIVNRWRRFCYFLLESGNIKKYIVDSEYSFKGPAIVMGLGPCCSFRVIFSGTSRLYGFTEEKRDRTGGDPFCPSAIRASKTAPQPSRIMGVMQQLEMQPAV